MLDSKIDIEVIRKEFEHETDYIKKLRDEALRDSETKDFNRSYYEGKYVVYNYMISELNKTYFQIMCSLGIVKNYKD